MTEPFNAHSETPDMATDQTDKAIESRMRRIARNQGLLLRKSRCRNERAIEFGTYMLVDATSNFVVAGPYLSIDQVEQYLMEANADQQVDPTSMSLDEWVTAGRPILDYPTPLGKTLGECTGKEMKQLARIEQKRGALQLRTGRMLNLLTKAR